MVGLLAALSVDALAGDNMGVAKTVTYKEFQWQLLKVDNKRTVYTVCPDGLIKNMYCYPSNSPMNHVGHTLLEQDLAAKEKNGVTVQSVVEDKHDNLIVTYLINEPGKATEFPAAISPRSKIEKLSGHDATGKKGINRAGPYIFYSTLVVAIVLFVIYCIVKVRILRFLYRKINGVIPTAQPSHTQKPSRHNLSDDPWCNGGVEKRPTNKRKITVD